MTRFGQGDVPGGGTGGATGAGETYGESAGSLYVLTLYVTGSTRRSSAAGAAVQALCEAVLPGRYRLEIVDVRRRPDLAEADHVIATPTLIKWSPAPARRIVGSMLDPDRLRQALDIEAADTVGAPPPARGPAAQAAEHPRSQTEESKAAGTPGGTPGVDRPLDILVVDDNPADVRLLQEALREAPIPSTQRVAQDGDAALDLLLPARAPARAAAGSRDGERPDLIVLDLNLPRVHGLDVLAVLKRHPRLRRIPVAVFTGSTTQSEITAAYDGHANCLVAKPQDAAEYGDRVREILAFWGQTAALPAV